MLDFKRLQIVSLIKTVFVATFALMFVVMPKVTNAADCVDIGLFVRENGSLAKICAENIAETTSPLRIAKSGIKYGVALVDPSDPNASKARIRIPGGITKALKKYVVPSVYPNFADQTHDVQRDGLGPTDFYAIFPISNVGDNNTYVFVRTNTSNINADKIGYSPTSFTLNPNSTMNLKLGRVTFPGKVDQVPDPTWIQGSATYSVRVGSSSGPEIDTVTYTWVYQ